MLAQGRGKYERSKSMSEYIKRSVLILYSAMVVDSREEEKEKDEALGRHNKD